MKVLIAEDEPNAYDRLETMLTRWGYEVQGVQDGDAAWEVLTGPEAPRLAVLDWMMPGLNGVEICRKLQEGGAAAPPYVILLTARVHRDDVVRGLEAGAQDYITKPFDRAELQARMEAARRIVALQQALADRAVELEAALSKVGRLEGLLPICMYCKRVRDGAHYWQRVEAYLAAHSDADIDTGVCPDCSRHEPGCG